MELWSSNSSTNQRRKLTELIQSTAELLVSHEKKELLGLLNDFRDEVDEDSINFVDKLEEPIDILLADEYLDGISI